MRDRKMRDLTARVENAGLENGGKRHCIEHPVFLMSSQSCSMLPLKKVKCAILLLEIRRGAHLPSYKGHEPVGGNTTIVCDAGPVRRQTYGYLPTRKASPRIGWYQIILLGDRGTCVLQTCPGLHSIVERPGFELATYWSQVQRHNHSATEPHSATIEYV